MSEISWDETEDGRIELAYASTTKIGLEWDTVAEGRRVTVATDSIGFGSSIRLSIVRISAKNSGAPLLLDTERFFGKPLAAYCRYTVISI